MSKANVSIVGQSREGVKIFNHPIVEGISYTSTIHVGKTATDFYAEDISMENQFKYWSSMNAGSGAGRAVVLWARGGRCLGGCGLLWLGGVRCRVAVDAVDEHA